MVKTGKKKNVKIRKRKPIVTWARISAVLNAKWFANLMVGLIIALLVTVLIYRIVEYGRKAEIFMVQIEAPATPDWIDRNKVEAFMRSDEFLSRKHSIFEDGLRQEVAARFAAQSWVKSVKSVRRSWPGDLIIELEYREPVILVESRYLADIDGVCLCDCKDQASGVYVAGLDQKVLPVENYKDNPDVQVGGQWQGRAIKAAAEVAVLLKPLAQWIEQNDGDRMKKISVAGFGIDGVPDIQIITKTGKIIEWGHAAEETNPNEPTQQDKLALLWNRYKTTPNLHYKNKDGQYADRIKLLWHENEAVFE